MISLDEACDRYALSVDELHQAFVPGRVASLVDLGYDSLAPRSSCWA